MYFVVFEGTVRPEQTALGEEYYTTLQPLLQKQPGFISETAYAAANDPNGQNLVASFKDMESMRGWRNEPTHLRMQQHSRVEIFEKFHIRIGPLIMDGAPQNVGSSSKQVLALYTHPHREDGKSEEDVMDLVKRDDHSVAKGLKTDLVDSAKYLNETDILWVSAWSRLEVANQFVAALKRLEGDSIKLVQVERDYGKFDRKDAPTEIPKDDGSKGAQEA